MKSLTHIAIIGISFIGTPLSCINEFIENRFNQKESKVVARSDFGLTAEATMLVTIEGDVHIYNFIPGLLIIQSNVGWTLSGCMLIIRSEKEDHPKIFVAPLSYRSIGLFWNTNKDSYKSSKRHNIGGA